MKFEDDGNNSITVYFDDDGIAGEISIPRQLDCYCFTGRGVTYSPENVYNILFKLQDLNKRLP